jgi:hypothetical protein
MTVTIVIALIDNMRLVAEADVNEVLIEVRPLGSAQGAWRVSRRDDFIRVLSVHA